MLADEAEEEGVDDIEALLNKRKNKKNAESAEQVQLSVDNLVGKMEAAAEDDVEVQAQRRPALHKLTMLREVEDFIVQRKYHQRFIAVRAGERLVCLS